MITDKDEAFIIKNPEGAILHWDDVNLDRKFPDNVIWLHHFYYPDILWSNEKQTIEDNFKKFPKFFKGCYVANYKECYEEEYGGEI